MVGDAAGVFKTLLALTSTTESWVVAAILTTLLLRLVVSAEAVYSGALFGVTKIHLHHPSIVVILWRIPTKFLNCIHNTHFTFFPLHQSFVQRPQRCRPGFQADSS